MAITITASELAEAIGGEDSPTIVARVLATASAIVTNYAPAAPDAVQNEAVVRFAGYLFGSDFGGMGRRPHGRTTPGLATVEDRREPSAGAVRVAGGRVRRGVQRVRRIRVTRHRRRRNFAT